MFLCARGTPKVYTAETLPADYLSFGSKGGFTGGGKTYLLLPSEGRRILLDDSLTDTLQTIGKLKGKELKAITAALDELDFSQPGQPGNMTSSLTRHRAGGKETIRWPNTGNGAGQPAKAVYQSLMEAVKGSGQ